MKSQYKYSILFVVLIILVLNLYILFSSIEAINRTYNNELDKIAYIQNYMDKYSVLSPDTFLDDARRIFNLEHLAIIGRTTDKNSIKGINLGIFYRELHKGIIKNTILRIDKEHYQFIIPEITKQYYIVGEYRSPLFQIIDSQRSLIIMAIISSFGILLVFVIISILAFKPMIYMESLAKDVRTPVKDESYYKYIPEVFKETIKALKEKNEELKKFYQIEKEHSKDVETYLTSTLNIMDVPIFLFKDKALLYKNELADRISPSFEEIKEILSSQNANEIKIGDNIYFVVENIIKRNNIYLGNLYMLFDITKDKNKNIIEKNISKLELLSNVSVNLAHEFKNSLGIISGYIQMLQKKSDNKELDILEAETTYMLNSINKFIEINRIKQINKQSFAIEEFQKHIIDIANSISLNLTFDIQKQGALNIDKQLFLQVVKNIFINAKEAGATAINFKIYESNTNTVLEIQDNGRGFSENAMNNLFVPFFTEKEHGSGIGMSFINKVVTLHNAILTVGNHENGAYVKITFME